MWLYSGLVGKVKTVAPSVQWTYCSLHLEVLAVKELDECLKKTVDDAVKTVNFIKSWPKNSKLLVSCLTKWPVNTNYFSFTVMFSGCQRVSNPIYFLGLGEKLTDLDPGHVGTQLYSSGKTD
mgnify:CR=1 FL=1